MYNILLFIIEEFLGLKIDLFVLVLFLLIVGVEVIVGIYFFVG